MEYTLEELGIESQEQEQEVLALINELDIDPCEAIDCIYDIGDYQVWC